MNLRLNPSMIYKLTTKDFLLFRPFLVVYILICALAAGVMIAPIEGAYYLGVILVITVSIGSGIHFALTSVIIEKKENQMSFIMGLPINATDYAVSKTVGGMVVYFLNWLPMLVITLSLIYFSHLPNGLIPISILCFLQILTGVVVVLCIGVGTGSEGFTIVMVVIFNILFNLFLSVVGQLPGISEFIQGNEAVFNATFFSVFGIEILALILVLSLTLFIKSRNACFL